MDNTHRMMNNTDKVRVRQNENAGYGLRPQEAHSFALGKRTDAAYGLQRIKV